MRTPGLSQGVKTRFKLIPSPLQGVGFGGSGQEKMPVPIPGWSLAELRRPRRGECPGAAGALDTYKAKALDFEKPSMIRKHIVTLCKGCEILIY